MKRIKDSEILPLITAPANLRQSIFKVLEGTARKDSKQGREILAHIDQIEEWLAAEISAGVFRLTCFGEEMIKKGDLFKFFTGYPDMWAICDRLKEAQMLDKNVVTVEKESNGKYTEFRFK